MSSLVFKHLNDDWNAEPNAPAVRVGANGAQIHLTFFLNPFIYDAEEGEVARLTFTDCSMWRLGSTNDEGWFAGQCRYSKIAPHWGEFYELIGPDERRTSPTDWRIPNPAGAGDRHFLFYLRDNTFECFAKDWSLETGLNEAAA